ncbi:DUF4062 domain-containing protein ['Paenibacillus yunnanensis' Narsing Rao et al. 2020]|uniref:DUF4062 domain-containing protein n=1 Tax=Paenibacillus tengchongensis TaxID=2608684 RepID=UPI00124CF494|nr:DUF4062 domain-containing protein [Paenibacillus tengchongensis]
MKKKLQVYISSTHTEMLAEREAAVLAVLNAGHIPAGMDLFKSGDSSHKAAVQRWIQESDVFMLILGGRYGGIEEESGKSFAHWEYDYAGALGKHRFAVVLNDHKLQEKTRENPIYLERINYSAYMNFKEQVKGERFTFFEDLKDIRLIALESLREFEADETLTGWRKPDLADNVEEALRENTALLKENGRLKADLDRLKKQQDQRVLINGFDYEELKNILDTTIVTLPKEVSSTKTKKNVSLLKVLITLSNTFATGITNGTGESDSRIALYYHVAPKLMSFGILEKVKVAGARYEKIQTSKEGHKFLAKYEMENALITPVAKSKAGTLRMKKDETIGE